MTTIETLEAHRARLESCPGCGAPMAADQRYCLGCGRRRGDPRLPFPQVVASPKPKPSAPPSEPLHESLPITWPVAVAGSALLVLALGMGVLIGHSTSKTARLSAAPAQVITVSGGAAPGAGAGPRAATAKRRSRPASAARHHKPHKPSASSSLPTHKKSATLSKQQLNKLESLSPRQYQKQSAKLPDTIKTEGKPAPIDRSKPIGGGSGSETIK